MNLDAFDVAMVGVAETIVSRARAVEQLRRLAGGVQEPDEPAAVSRLLERLASAPPEVTAALLEEGARAVLREARR